MDHERPSHHEVLYSTATTAHDMHPQSVPVNAYETPGAFVVLAPMPAVTCDDVTIDLTEGKLRFYAELRSAGPRDFTIHEWEYGGFERQLDVPKGFGSGLEAALTNGQLAIRVIRGTQTRRLTIHPSG